jgi:hypothetical protein
VEIDSNPGLTFYELYMTEGVPRLTVSVVFRPRL